MTNEQKVLLKLVSAAIKGSTAEIANPETVDWGRVASESDIQSVLPRVLDAATPFKHNIPEEVYKDWSDRAIKYLVNNTKVQTSQQKLVKLLTDAGYSYTILKGESSIKYYNRPDLRILGDVDFLIDPSQNDEIIKLLCDNGYTKGHDTKTHTAFEKAGIDFELHRDVQGLPEGVIGEKLREITKSILQESEKPPETDFITPAKHHHALILLLHAQHHMIGEGMGLRHLLDWAEFVNKTQNEPFWDELLKLLEQTGLLTFAKVLTKTCQVAFDMPCPDWAEASETLCNQILDDVFSSGNFGRKDYSRIRTGVLIKDKNSGGVSKNKYKKIFRVLVNNVKNKHPRVVKYPILYPVYFIFEILRYMWLVLTGRRPSIKKIVKDVDERKKIYQQLKIFEV